MEWQMGTESPSELPGIKPSICKIRMFLRGSNVSRKQQREDPAVLDARSASGQQAGGGLWAGGLREGAGAGRGDMETGAARGRRRGGQSEGDAEGPGAQCGDSQRRAPR